MKIEIIVPPNRPACMLAEAEIHFDEPGALDGAILRGFSIWAGGFQARELRVIFPAPEIVADAATRHEYVTRAPRLRLAIAGAFARSLIGRDVVVSDAAHRDSGRRASVIGAHATRSGTLGIDLDVRMPGGRHVTIDAFDTDIFD